jgi:hypothetical protein
MGTPAVGERLLLVVQIPDQSTLALDGEAAYLSRPKASGCGS